MMALSIWQPWASLIIYGFKQFETRRWRTNYQGPLLIHAAKRWQEDQEKLCQDTLIQRLIEQMPRQEMPLGAVIGAVDLIECHKTELIEVSKAELYLGNFRPHRFAWALSNPRPFRDPIPLRGSLGLFKVHVTPTLTHQLCGMDCYAN